MLLLIGKSFTVYYLRFAWAAGGDATPCNTADDAAATQTVIQSTFKHAPKRSKLLSGVRC